MSTSNTCCLPNCINVTVNCKDCLIDTNCYIHYDPLVCNIRKIYKSYEERAKNVKYEYESCGDASACCKPTLKTSCFTIPQFWEDYKIRVAGYSYYGGCPKKSVIKFYDSKKLNDLFAENYVVERTVAGKTVKSVICEDICPLRLCQPANIPANSRFRLFFVFAYKYEICDTIYCEDKPWKYDLYVADLPSVNCLNQDTCRIPQLQLQLVATLDSENFESVGCEAPQCVLCAQPTVPVSDCRESSYSIANLRGCSGGTGGYDNETLQEELEILPLILKYTV